MIKKGTILITNKKGFTLLELVVASSILVTVLYIASTAFLQTSKQFTLFSVNKEVVDLVDDLNHVIKNSACGIVRLSDTTDSISIQEDFFDDTNNFIELNGESDDDGLSGSGLRIRKNDIFGKLKIESIEITPRLLPYSDPPEFAYVKRGNNVVYGALRVTHISTTGVHKPGGPESYVWKDVILHLNDEGNRIVNCTTFEQASILREACEVMGGDWDDELFSCKLENQGANESGVSNICPYNETCNTDPQFQLEN